MPSSQSFPQQEFWKERNAHRVVGITGDWRERRQRKRHQTKGLMRKNNSCARAL